MAFYIGMAFYILQSLPNNTWKHFKALKFGWEGHSSPEFQTAMTPLSDKHHCLALEKAQQLKCERGHGEIRDADGKRLHWSSPLTAACSVSFPTHAGDSTAVMVPLQNSTWPTCKAWELTNACGYAIWRVLLFMASFTSFARITRQSPQKHFIFTGATRMDQLLSSSCSHLIWLSH